MFSLVGLRDNVGSGRILESIDVIINSIRNKGCARSGEVGKRLN